MIDGERRGYQAASTEILPMVQEALREGVVLTLPSDEVIQRMAATTWDLYQAASYAHIEPREAFLRGYATAIRNLICEYGASRAKQGSEEHAYGLSTQKREGRSQPGK